MRKSGITYAYISMFIIHCIACTSNKKVTDLEIKRLDYPSASSIEYYDGKLYLMGDDATKLLVLDTNLNIVDSIPIISYPENRIPKTIKPDLEASAIKGDDLFLFGSGSLSPYRNFAWRHNLKTKANDSINLEPLFLKAKEQGIEQINIEGACFVSGKLILVNRGNKSYPHNHLIIADEKLLDNDSSFQIFIMPFAPQKDTASFKGTSGLCYAKESDQLILTISTEDTRSSHEDGAIGKSYLWIINNFSTKIINRALGTKRVIDLEYIDPRFKGQKIEAATVIKETDKLIYLALVGENDDGKSIVFKMSITRAISLAE
ncbi:MAG TPA: hypothetical protein VHQ93_16730 [Chitinophagaceae bacterium]|jgi:hypothetical protein|nr:hypothetical protein [Chitinophagaceae bacterium]